MLLDAFIHKYAWPLNTVVLQDHVTNEIPSQHLEDVSTPCYARCWLNVRVSHTWPFDQVINVRSVWKSIFSILTRFIANKIGRLLNLGMIFSVQINHLVSFSKSKGITCNSKILVNKFHYISLITLVLFLVLMFSF